MANIVYIATSLDGYIADKNEGLEWLETIPNPDNIDFGFADFMERIDGIIMGRKTFEKVISFDCDWPYPKPVFVLSSSLQELPGVFDQKAEIIKGDLEDILKDLNSKGFENLYIDGGVTIQNFLKKDLIDEMIITTIPILLGGGKSLFSDLNNHMEFDLIKSEVLLNQMVKNHYSRKRI